MARPDQLIKLKIKTQGPNLCLSGGAQGADTLWGQECYLAGYGVIHWSFPGHLSAYYMQKDALIELTEEELAAADESLHKANETLKRAYPPKNLFVQNLLRRNFYQINRSSSLYCISVLNDKAEVVGGSSWAIQMFVDKNGFEKPIYLFCQSRRGWFQYQKTGWTLSGDIPPKPRGIFTGIGTRAINNAGVVAVRTLFSEGE